MSAKILTTSVVGIASFYRDPGAALTASEQGAVAVLDNNAPAFYALTPQRLAALLALEARIQCQPSDITLAPELYNDADSAPVETPMGKFAMYPGWLPDTDFLRMSALWGIFLKEDVTPEELAAFIAYWQAEGKVFHHVQWQQKLARHVQIARAANGGAPLRDINSLSQPGDAIPEGFRG